MSESSNLTTKAPLFELLPKVSNYMIAGALLCYVSGFAITNLYLGSMGIVNFDILRARYVVAGLLFLIFVAAIIYLTYGLMQTLRKHYGQPRLKVLSRILWYSFYSLGVLYIAVPAIGVFAGSLGKPPYLIPQPVESDIPWTDWLNQAPLAVLQGTATLFGLVLFSAMIMVIILIAINPKDKDGNRTPRRQIIAQALGKTRAGLGFIFGSLAGVFALMYILNLLANLLVFVVSRKVSTAIISVTPSLQGGWAQFFFAIVLVYSLIAAYITLIFFFPPSSVISEDDTALSRTSAMIYFAAVSIALVVPMYAFSVYPHLPQQVGGGQIISVEIKVSDDDIKAQAEDPQIEIYLIDRTSNGSIFLLLNTNTQAHKIMEIPNGLIQSITYSQSP